MARYLVDTPDGKTIPVEGPEDATDEELIGFAQKYMSENKPPTSSAKPPKPTAADDSTNLEPGVLPELSSPAELAKTAKKGTNFTNQSVAQPPADAQPDRSEGTTFDLLSQGKFGEAFNTIPETVQKGILVGLPLTAATIAGGLGLKYARSKNEVDGIGPTRGQGINPAERIEPTGGPAETPSNNIKSRTFEAGNYGQQNIRTTPTGMSAKETQIADDIKNRYGFDLNDLKNRFGLADVPINDVTQAEMLANTVRNQETAAAAVPAEAPKTPVVEAPAERIVNGVKMTEAEYRYFLFDAKPGLSPEEAIKEFNAKTATPAAPVAETPKAPAPPPEAAPPQAAVPPEEKKKGGRPTASSMEGTTFRPDLGPGDNWLYNTAGPERRKLILQEFNEGKPAKTQEMAVKLYQEYKKKYPKDMFGPVIPTSVAVERGIKPPENYGKLGKAAKVSGVAGLALTAAELANAAQQSSKGDNAPLRESLFNLLGMIPGLGTAFSGATYAGGLNENEAADLARRRKLPPTITTR